MPLPTDSAHKAQACLAGLSLNVWPAGLIATEPHPDTTLVHPWLDGSWFALLMR